MTRRRLTHDTEGRTVRPRTRQTRKEPTMPSQPDDAVWLIADPTEGQPGGRIIVNLVDASAAMELARDLTHEIHDLTDQESWTDEDETTPGHECWAVEWAEDAGWDTVTAADGILSSVDVEVTYDEGVPDLKRSSEQFNRAIAAHDRALREQIAQKIEVEMRRHDNAQIGFSAVGDAYAHAARIAREEGE